MGSSQRGPAGQTPLAAISLAIVIVAGALFFFWPDSGKDGSDESSYSPEPPAVPQEYVKWIRRSAGQCRAMTPQLVASQIYQESRFDPRAVSATGARGLGQFMPGTWQTWGRDDDGNGKTRRRDPGDSIMAMGRMMCVLSRKAKQSGWKPGQVELALAAYNAGWGAVAKYHGMPPYRETKAYVAVVTKLARDRIPVLPAKTPQPATRTGG